MTSQAVPVSAPRTAPRLREHNPLTAISVFRGRQLEFLLRAAEVGEVVRFYIGPMQCVLLREPDHVKHVLVDHSANYDKRTRGYDELRRFLGNGLLTSEGDFWRRQRRIAQPAFHKKRIAAFAQSMTATIVELLDSWQSRLRTSAVLDVHEEMTTLTLRIAGKTLLGSEVEQVAHDVGHAVNVLNLWAHRRITNPIPAPLWLPSPGNRKARGCMRRLDQIVNEIIDQRRRDPEPPNDLLTMLMEARDEDTGEGMTDAQLRDEVVTMFLAGHETTANALSWTFYLLSLHPEIARRIESEIDDVLAGRLPTAEDLQALVHTERAVKETLRLFPPAWGIDRRTVEDDVIGGYRIPKNALVFICPWVTHHQPHLWENPMGFDPDRFSPELDKARHRYAYFPFGGGPRFCIGAPFAIMEAILVLATVMQRHRLHLVPGHKVRADPLITLRPRGPIFMRVSPR